MVVDDLADLVEFLQADQRRRWLEGERPVVESYFALHPRLLAEAALALQLVYNELLLREAEGERPQMEDYVRRFPQFTEQLAPLFEVHQALESDQFLAAVADKVSLDETLPRHEAQADSRWPTVGGHEILQELGRGAMGVVYKARQSGLNRVVALKMILAGSHANALQLDRFRAEGEAVARLQHPNIVQIHEVGEQEGRPYFSMEFVDGPSLAQGLCGSPQPAGQAATLVRTLAWAIHTAHQKGIIHRDLKPSNILLQIADCRCEIADFKTQILNPQAAIPKITDFGLAKNLDLDAEQTASGMIVGTPSYMAPEQARGQNHAIGPATDVYALGAILYELLTGHPPFKAETQVDTLRQVLAEEPVPLSRFHLKVPHDLNTICMKCLQKEPQRRYASAAALADDLERFLTHQAIHARRTSALERVGRWCRRNPLEAGLAFAVAGLLLAGALGASLAALRLRTEQSATLAQLHQTEEAEGVARQRLFGSLLAQARASRLSHRQGQRFKTLEVVAEAAGMARSLNLGEDELRKLRSEALSCLALTDVRVDHEWEGWPAGSFSVTFDGALERYARADRDGTISVRRVADDRELYHLPCLSPGETNSLFSDDGRFLAVTCASHVKLWKLTGPKPVAVLEEQAGRGWDFSLDGLQLALGHAGGTISLYDLTSRQQPRRLCTARSVTGLAFHPTGARLAVTFEDGAQVLDLHTGKVLADLERGARTSCPAWNPDGKLLAMAVKDRQIALWEVPTGKPCRILEGPKNNVTHLTFTHAGDILASTGWDGVLRLWDPRSGEQIFSTYLGLPALRFSPDDRRLAANVEGNKLQILEVGARQVYRTLVREPAVGRDAHVSNAAASKDGLLAVAGANGAWIWELASGKELAFFSLPEVYFVLFEPSGALVTNGPAGVWRWPVRDEPAAPGLVGIGPPQRLALAGSNAQIAGSADGRVLATTQTCGGLVQHADHPEQLIRLTRHADVRAIAVNPDGCLVATGSHNGTGVKIWDSRNGQLKKDLLLGITHLQVEFSPNGKWLATGGDGCRLWMVEGWRQGPQIGGGAFTFSPDSALLAVETGFGAVRLVAPETGREYARLEDPNQERARWLTFSADGTQLVVSTHDGPSIHVWDLRAIRRHLAATRLDWDLPAYAPPPLNTKRPPLRLVVDCGPFAEALSGHGRASLLAHSLALSLQPLNPEAYYQRALAHVLLKQWPQALDDCSRALALRPDHMQSYYLRGLLHEHLGQHRRALRDFSAAVQREPCRVPSLDALQAALTTESRSATELNDLAWTYLGGPPEQGTAGLGALLAEEAVLLEPGNWYCRNTLGVAYYRLGRWRQAVYVLEGALALSGGRFDAYDLFFLAMAYQHLGRGNAARAAYERADRWWTAHDRLSPQDKQELSLFRAEARALLRLP